MEMQGQRTDPVNHGKVMSSQEQTATQLNTIVGRNLGIPDQSVTQIEDMRSGTGPVGKQDPQRTLNSAKSEHLLVYYSAKDTRTLLVISNFLFYLVYLFRVFLCSFAPVLSIHVMGGKM